MRDERVRVCKSSCCANSKRRLNNFIIQLRRCNQMLIPLPVPKSSLLLPSSPSSSSSSSLMPKLMLLADCMTVHTHYIRVFAVRLAENRCLALSDIECVNPALALFSVVGHSILCTYSCTGKNKSNLKKHVFKISNCCT